MFHKLSRREALHLFSTHFQTDEELAERLVHLPRARLKEEYQYLESNKKYPTSLGNRALQDQSLRCFELISRRAVYSAVVMTLWHLKPIIGKDVARLIAKMIHKTRNEVTIWL